MTRNVPAWVLLLCAGWGCVRQGASPAPAAPQAPHGWEMMPTTHLRVQLQPLGRVPNSGLQLPAVSPDGEWVAYLQVAPDQEVQPEGLFSGKGLQAVSLSMRRVGADGTAQGICTAGACWPAWSADSRRLAFVAYQDSGRCELCIHNLTTGKTRRTAVGLKHLLAPVFSPSGCYLAVAGSNLPDQSQLHIFDPSTAELQAGPPAKGAHQQLWPHWVDDRTLVYLAHEDDGSFLCRWTRGSGVPPERLCQVNTSSSALGSSQVFAGLAGPLSPGGRRLAYYDPAADALTLIDLADGRKHTLKTRTQAGCWMGSRRFAAATDKELFVASPDTSEQAEVMRGPWLPRWANPEANQLVLCTRSPEPWTFELVRLQLNP